MLAFLVVVHFRDFSELPHLAVKVNDLPLAWGVISNSGVTPAVCAGPSELVDPWGSAACAVVENGISTAVSKTAKKIDRVDLIFTNQTFVC